jgi:hypothetical protein
MGIGIGEAAGHSHVITNMTVTQQRVDRGEVTSIFPEGFVRRDAEETSLTNDIYGSNDWVKWGIRLASIFSNGEVLTTFVEKESKMKFPDVIEGHLETTELAINLNSKSIVEDIVIGYIRKRLLSPRTCVSRIGNASVLRFGSGARVGLAVF